MDDKLSKLLDDASDLELKVADIYDALSHRFSTEPRLANFWALFAEAERYHSLLIQMQKMMVDPPALSGERLDEWNASMQRAGFQLDGYRNRLKSDGWVPSVSEAFALAHEIESQSLEIQATGLEFAERDAITELFLKLHQEDEGHLGKLLQARHQFDPGFVPAPAL